jgi:hypothetical protein
MHDNYEKGVALAQQRNAERDDRIKANYNALFDTIASLDAGPAKEAQVRAAARLAKYPPSRVNVKFTPVAKGSVPLRRPSPFSFLNGQLRRARRIVERLAAKRKEVVS